MKLRFNSINHPIMSEAPESVVTALEGAGTIEGVIEALITLTRKESETNYRRLSGLSEYLSTLLALSSKMATEDPPSPDEARRVIQLICDGIEGAVKNVAMYVNSNGGDLSESFQSTLSASIDTEAPPTKDMN